MANPLDADVAGGGVLSTTAAPFELFAGEAPVVTNPGVVASGQGELTKYTVVAKNAAGKLVALATGVTDGTEIAVGIICQPVDATAEDVNVPYYTGGYFNHEALTWPAALDTLEERIAVFERTPIRIGTVLP